MPPISLPGLAARSTACGTRLRLGQVRNSIVGGDYTLDHFSALVPIDPRARLAKYLAPPHYFGALFADLASINGRPP